MWGILLDREEGHGVMIRSRRNDTCRMGQCFPRYSQCTTCHGGEMQYFIRVLQDSQFGSERYVSEH